MKSLHKEEEMIILSWIHKNPHPQSESPSRGETGGNQVAPCAMGAICGKV